MSYFKTKEGSLESSINEVSKHLKDSGTIPQFFKKELEKNWQRYWHIMSGREKKISLTK